MSDLMMLLHITRVITIDYFSNPSNTLTESSMDHSGGLPDVTVVKVQTVGWLNICFNAVQLRTDTLLSTQDV